MWTRWWRTRFDGLTRVSDPRNHEQASHTGHTDAHEQLNGAPPAHRKDEGAPKRRHRRVVRQGTEREVISGVSRDERADVWGEHQQRQGRDAEILADVPPHFGTI